MSLKHLFRFIFVISALVLISPNFSYAQNDITSFYPKAYAKTQNPPEEKKLIIIAEQKIEDKYVTFIGMEKGKVLLAAITKEKIKDPQKSLYLTARFEKVTKKVKNPYFTITFAKKLFLDPGEIIDWGYVFDRNGDGKIDYVSYLIGALPVKQNNFPENFPKRGEEAVLSDESRPLAVFIFCSRLNFAHYADDNFDGKIDAAVIERMDLERDWIDKWMVLRSTNFNDICDTCWFFKENISEKAGKCLRTNKGYWAHRVGGSVDFGKEEFINLSYSLLIFNQAASLCGLTKDSFYKE